MTTSASLPKLQDHLPELAAFIRRLADEHQRGVLTSGQQFVGMVRAFYTPAMMAKIETVVPGWGKMASFDNQQTLIHVTSVVTALLLLPEYQNATSEQQVIMEWTALFHDIAKEPQHPHHDYVHGFRGGAVTGKALHALGFPVTASYATDVDEWYTLTYNATIFDSMYNEDIQDNSKLPEIIGGIERFYGADSPGTLVTKGVLLHVSLPVDPDYPTLAPLSKREMERYVNAAFFPIIVAMMLADDGGWNLFDRERTASQRVKVLDYFDPIGERIGVR